MRNFFKEAKNYLEKVKKESNKELENIENLDKGLDSKGFKLFEKEQKYNAGFIFKFWFIGALTVYICFLAFKALDIIYLISAAYIISIAVESVILFFQHKVKLGRGIAILVSYILIFAFFLGGFLLIVPFVVDQFGTILNILLAKFQELQSVLDNKGLSEMIKSIGFLPMKGAIADYVNNKEVMNGLQSVLETNISSIISFGSNLTKDFGSIVVNVFTYLISGIYSVGLTFILAIFFSLEKDDVIKVLAAFSGQSELFSVKIKKIYLKLGYWLKGQLLLSLIIGVMVYVLLFSLQLFGIDIPYKGTLALIAGLTEFIPYLGPLLGALPALLIAFPTYGIFGVAVVGITYYLVQAAENNIIVPRIMTLTLGVSSLLIFLAMLIGAATLGMVGVVLAVPLAVIISIAFEDFVLKKK